jgi:hypothetical protein
MSTKNETISQALGLEPVAGQDIYFQKVAKECLQAVHQGERSSDVLIGIGERAKFYHFLDESPLSKYEKDLLFRGFNVGASLCKAQITERLSQLMPPGLLNMIMGVDRLSENNESEDSE